MSVTFAVIGRNEAPWLRTALLQALDTARPGDRVVFVDGGSTDVSAAIAESLDVEVIHAGAGKGRSIAAAGRAAAGSALCTVDADIHWSERNIPAGLRDAFERSGADMILGHVAESNRARLIVPGLYRPLVGALFPEAAAVAGSTPLTGFRLLAPGRLPADLPGGYGVETHLNLRFALGGLQVENVSLGEYEGPLKAYVSLPSMAIDVAAAILDVAESEGRLDADARPEWEEWTEALIDHARSLPVASSGRRAFEERVAELGARPLPSAYPIAVGR